MRTAWQRPERGGSPVSLTAGATGESGRPPARDDSITVDGSSGPYGGPPRVRGRLRALDSGVVVGKTRARAGVFPRTMCTIRGQPSISTATVHRTPAACTARSRLIRYGRDARGTTSSAPADGCRSTTPDRPRLAQRPRVIRNRADH